MAKKNRNSKVARRPAKQKKSARERRREKVASFEASLLGKARPPREDRHVLVAMVMASLIAGILFVINVDRVTHLSRTDKMDFGTSMHGWPLVYLERHFENLPDLLIHTRISNWPLPVVKDEVRTFNVTYLFLDLLCCIAIVVGCYFLFRTIVFRYDRWKKTWN